MINVHVYKGVSREEADIAGTASIAPSITLNIYGLSEIKKLHWILKRALNTAPPDSPSNVIWFELCDKLEHFISTVKE